MEAQATVVDLALDEPVWERVYTVAPLVLVGTREPDGGFDIAPKHLAMPLGWGPYYGFVCTPRHATYRNAVREGAFTVTYPGAEQVVESSLAAAPRRGDSKPGLEGLSTRPASRVDGVLVEGGRLFLECELERVVDGFGGSGLVVGRVVAAAADRSALRSPDRDDQELLSEQPPLVYLSPDRYGTVDRSSAFPFHVGFEW